MAARPEFTLDKTGFNALATTAQRLRAFMRPEGHADYLINLGGNPNLPIRMVVTLDDELLDILGREGDAYYEEARVLGETLSEQERQDLRNTRLNGIAWVVQWMAHGRRALKQLAKCQNLNALYKKKVEELMATTAAKSEANASLILDMATMEETMKRLTEEMRGMQTRLDAKLKHHEADLAKLAGDKKKTDARLNAEYAERQRVEHVVKKLQEEVAAKEAETASHLARTKAVERDVAALRETNVQQQEELAGLLDDQAILHVGEILKIYQLTLCAWVLDLPLLDMLQVPKETLPRNVRYLTDLATHMTANVPATGGDAAQRSMRQRWRALVGYMAQRGLTIEAVGQQLRRYGPLHRTALAHPHIVAMLQNERRADVEAHFQRVFRAVRDAPLTAVLRFVQEHMTTRWEALAHVQPGEVVAALPDYPQTPEELHTVFAHYLLTGHVPALG